MMSRRDDISLSHPGKRINSFHSSLSLYSGGGEEGVCHRAQMSFQGLASFPQARLVSVQTATGSASHGQNDPAADVIYIAAVWLRALQGSELVDWAGRAAAAVLTVVSPHSIQMCEVSWPLPQGNTSLCSGGRGLREQRDSTLYSPLTNPHVPSRLPHSQTQAGCLHTNPARLRRSENSPCNMAISLAGSSRSTGKNCKPLPPGFQTDRRPDQLWTINLGLPSSHLTNPVPVLGHWRFVVLGHKKEPLSQEHKER